MPRWLESSSLQPVLLRLAAAYAVICLIMFLIQKKFLYYPSDDIFGNPADVGIPFQSLRLQTADGESLEAWHIPYLDSPVTVLYCHGNGGNISMRLDTARFFHQLGLSLFMFDYRGYGQSSGSPSEKGLYIDADAAWRYLVETLHIEPEKIVLRGHSLGGAVAAHLASERKVGALILESTFPSATAVGQATFPWLPVRWLLWHRYDNLDQLRDSRIPVLVMHSRSDELIPFRFGESVYARVGGQKKFVEISGDHNTGFLTSKSYAAAIKALIQSLN
jgi:fermentation-respiration switch protein FrsA (DUF1100 family)